METLLNLLWVCVAALGFALWRAHPAPTGRMTGATQRQQFLALLLLLAVLFPVISLTDDLQSTTVWAEAEGSGRRLLQAHLVIAQTLSVPVTLASLWMAPAGDESQAQSAASDSPARLQPAHWLHANATRPPPQA